MTIFNVLGSLMNIYKDNGTFYNKLIPIQYLNITDVICRSGKQKWTRIQNSDTNWLMTNSGSEMKMHLMLNLWFCTNLSILNF